MSTRKQRLLFLLGLSFALIIFSFWLLAFWPGLFNYDTMVNIDHLYQGRYDDWNSYLYYLYLYALGLPHTSIAVVGCVQIFVATYTGTFLFFMMWRWGSPLWLCALSYLAFVISPLNGAFNIYYVYDWFFSWSHLVIAMIMVAIVRNYRLNGILSQNLLFFVVALIPLVIRWRIDALLLILVVPAIAFLTLRLTWKIWGCYWAIFSLSVITFFIFLPNILDVDDRGPKYALTTILNPLSFILYKTQHMHDHSIQAENERQVIDRVVDYRRLIEERSDYEIPAFHYGAARDSFTKAQAIDFFKMSGRLFWRHHDLFFLNRHQMFTAIIGTTVTSYTADDLADGNYKFANEVRKKYNLSSHSKLPQLRTYLKGILNKIVTKSGFLSRYISSLTICLWACVLSILLFRRTPLSAIAVLIMCCRIPIVFFLAPANHFKYVYGLYIFGFFLIPLMGAELAQSLKDNGPCA